MSNMRHAKECKQQRYIPVHVSISAIDCTCIRYTYIFSIRLSLVWISHPYTGLQINMRLKAIIFYFSSKTYVVGTQKKRLIGSFEHSKQMFNQVDKKVFTISFPILCSSRPIHILHLGNTSSCRLQSFTDTHMNPVKLDIDQSCSDPR